MCDKILETFRRGWLRGQILLVLGSAGAWTGAILADKSDSSRHSTTSFSEIVR